MIKISKMADYAVIILVSLVKSEGVIMSSSAIAQQTNLPEPTVSKILKILSSEDIVVSRRGMKGGYAVTDGASSINLASIIEAIDGPIAITTCTDSHGPDCELALSCGVRGRWDTVNMAIRDALEGVTLADMVIKKNTQMKELAYGRY